MLIERQFGDCVGFFEGGNFVFEKFIDLLNQFSPFENLLLENSLKYE